MGKEVKTVREIMTAKLRAGYSNAATLAAIVAVHPYSKVTKATVNYHRNQLRRTHPKIPLDSQCRK